MYLHTLMLNRHIGVVVLLVFVEVTCDFSKFSHLSKNHLISV